MALVVYKYEILSPAAFSVQMPSGARILSVGDQDGRAFVWALVDTNAPLVERRISGVPTGLPSGETHEGTPISRFDLEGFAERFIGTVHRLGDRKNLVFHFFDFGEE